MNNKLQVVTFLLFSFVCGAMSPYIGLNNDTSGVLVEAQRILNGQNPLTDYYSPFSPITGILAAVFIKYTSLSFLCGITNLIYCLIVYKILKKNSAPDLDANFSIIIGSIWFLPQIGSYYYDNLAVIFALLGLLCIFSDFKRSLILGGAFYALSFYTKQNTGFAYLIAATGMFFIQLNLDGIKKALVLLGTFFIFSIALFLVMELTGHREYFQNYFKAILNYGTATGKISLASLINNLYEPFRINILSLNNIGHKGILIFYPILIMYLFVNWLMLKAIFTRKFSTKNLFIINLGFSNLLIQSLIGRGFTNLNYNLPLMISILFNISKVKRKVIYSIFIFIGFIYFYYESSINNSKNIKDIRIADIEILIKEAYNNNDNKNISIIGYSDSNNFSISQGLLSINYLIFINNLSLDVGENANIIWQNHEIDNIAKFQPKIILIDKKFQRNGDVGLIERSITPYYRLTNSDGGFAVWTKI